MSREMSYEKLMKDAIRVGEYDNIPPVGSIILVNEKGDCFIGRSFEQSNERFCCEVLPDTHERLLFVNIFVNENYSIRRAYQKVDFACRRYEWRIVQEVYYNGYGCCSYEELSIDKVHIA